MALETTWFHFRIHCEDSDPVEDRIPAETEAEARATIGRVYSKAYQVQLLKVEKKESLFANFRPGMTSAASSRRITTQPESLMSVECPECSGHIRLRKDVRESSETCLQCRTLWNIRKAQDSVFVFVPANAQGRSNITTPAETPSEERPWHAVLECDPMSDVRGIRAAYLEQIRLYHPDKVAHLGPDIIAFAENRTAQINAALQDGLKVARKQKA